MLRVQVVTSVVLLAFASPQPVRAGGEPVREDLASMVEQVVVQTGLSINVSESTPTSVNINQVNGRSVCAAEARSDVEKLQLAFESHPDIHRNIGPVLIRITDRSGNKTPGEPSELERAGVVKGCPNVCVSVHE